MHARDEHVVVTVPTTSNPKEQATPTPETAVAEPRQDYELGRMLYIAVEARRVGVSYATMEKRLGDPIKLETVWARIAGKLLDAVDASVNARLAGLLTS